MTELTPPDDASPQKHTPEDSEDDPVSCRTFTHVARLPSSFLSLLPHARPSDLTLVLPHLQLCAIKAQHGDIVLVNDRIATVYSTHRLLALPTEQLSDSVPLPQIALLSPCLHAAIDTKAGITVRVVEKPAPLRSVTLYILSPIYIPSTYATRAANLARVALLGRGVLEGDIVPASRVLCFVVASVDSLNDLHVVSESTQIGVRTSRPIVHADSPSMTSAIREWALFRWSRNMTFLRADSSNVVAAISELEAVAHVRPPLTLLLGTIRDIRSVIAQVGVGRCITCVSSSKQNAVITATARAELAGGGTVVVMIAPLSTGADAVLRVVERQRGALEHLGLNMSPKVGMVVCAREVDAIETRLRRAADVIIEIDTASENERRSIVAAVGTPSAQIAHIAKLSAGFARRDVANLALLFMRYGLRSCESAAKFLTPTAPAIDVRSASWSDVGGLEDIKKQVSALVGSETLRKRTRRSGILLYGPPGTGKTLVARAVAGESSHAFIAVKGPELLDMYVGESERNVRNVFETAIACAPTVIFFDEIDALAPRRGASSDAGRVSDRIVAQLLGEMDGASANGVAVIAATNRPDLVDVALLRPGRFDKLVYVPMPDSRDAQLSILKAQIRKFSLEEDVCLEGALNMTPPPPRISGADLYALASNAWMNAAKRAINETVHEDEAELDKSSAGQNAAHDFITYSKELYNLEEIYRGWFMEKDLDIDVDSDGSNETFDEERPKNRNVAVSQEDFERAAKTLKPSLTASQVEEYELLRRKLEHGW